MKLTLTREQIPLAREMVAFLRFDGQQSVERRQLCPGRDEWIESDATDTDWSDALEAAITEAEGTQAPASIPFVTRSEHDERQLWLNTVAAYVSQGELATSACNEADEALARYRKAFGGES